MIVDGVLLEALSVFLGVTTLTVPVVAPVGTVLVVWVLDALKVASVPLKVTLVAPARLLPKMVNFIPTVPEIDSSPRTDQGPPTG